MPAGMPSPRAFVLYNTYKYVLWSAKVAFKFNLNEKRGHQRSLVFLWSTECTEYGVYGAIPAELTRLTGIRTFNKPTGQSADFL